MNAVAYDQRGNVVAVAQHGKITFANKEFGRKFKASMEAGVPVNPDSTDESNSHRLGDILNYLSRCGYDVEYDVDLDTAISDDTSTKEGSDVAKGDKYIKHDDMWCPIGRHHKDQMLQAHHNEAVAKQNSQDPVEPSELSIPHVTQQEETFTGPRFTIETSGENSLIEGRPGPINFSVRDSKTGQLVDLGGIDRHMKGHTVTSVDPSYSGQLQERVQEYAQKLNQGVLDPEVVASTYVIPEEKLGWLKWKIEKLNKVAKKVGAPEVQFEELSFKDIPYKDEHDRPQIRREYEVRVKGETPKLNGWSFIGTIQHGEEVGNIVRSVPGEEMPVKFRNGDPTCDYCHTRRRRTDTYVLKNDDGTYKEIGHNCIKDFLGGHGDPDNLARLAQMMAQLNPEGEVDEDELRVHGGKGIQRWDVEDFMNWTAAAIRQYGWMSANRLRNMTEAEEGHHRSQGNPLITTATWSREAMTSHHRRGDELYQEEGIGSRKHLVKVLEVTQADKDRAKKALDWAQDNLNSVDDPSTLSDYLYNLRVASSGSSIDARTAGIAASLIATAEHTEERAAANKLAAEERAKTVEQGRAQSTHQGAVGDKIERNVKVTGVSDINTDFGVTRIHRMVDDQGNHYTWFASGGGGFQPGDEVTIKGTVKQHGEFNGVKQTTLTRVSQAGVPKLNYNHKDALRQLARRENGVPVSGQYTTPEGEVREHLWYNDKLMGALVAHGLVEQDGDHWKITDKGKSFA